MGAYLHDRGLVWSLKASSMPTPSDVAKHVERLSELNCVQIELGGLTKISSRLVRMLREKIFETRADVELRLYFADELDLSVLEELPMLQRLNVEVGRQLHGESSLAKLRDLRKVGFALPKVVSRDLLHHLPTTIESLVMQPRDRAKHGDIDLAPMANFPDLRLLILESYERELPRLLRLLRSLRRLGLRSIKKMKTLEPLAGLSNLKSLTVLVGGLESIDALTDLPNLAYLQLWNVAKLASVEPIASMTALQVLRLETLNKVTAFPETRNLARLRAVHLATMKLLRDFSTLERAPVLEEFVIQKADTQRPADFIPVLRNPRLERAGFGFQKKDDVKEMTELCAARGIDAQIYLYPQLRGDFSTLANFGEE
jgi:hypothetical protein